MLGVPAIVTIQENWVALGLPTGTPHHVAIGAWIVWLIVWTLGLAEWHERRFRPRLAKE